MKHHRTGTARFAALLALGLLIAAPVMALAQGEEGFFEDFEDGEAQGWSLEQGWFISDGVLVNDGSAFASYAAAWSDMLLGFDLLRFTGSMEVYLHYNGQTAAIVRFESSSEGLILSAGRLINQSYQAQVREIVRLPTGAAILIRSEGRLIEVQFNKEPVLRYEDAEGLEAPGGIALRLIEGTALLDNVFVTPQAGPLVTEPGEPDVSQPQVPSPDLRIDAVDIFFDEGSRERAILAEVHALNAGPGESAPAPLLVTVEGFEGVSASGEIPPLPPEGSIVVPLILPLPQGLEGEDIRIIAEAFPALDGDPGNNRAVSALITVPGATDPFLMVFVVLGTGAMMMLAVGSGFAAMARRAQRKSLQRKASTRKPSEPCQPGQQYVGVEPEISLKPAHFSEVSFTLESANAQAQTVEKRVQDGPLNRSLTLAMHGVITGLLPAETGAQIEQAAQLLAAAMSREVRSVGGIRNVTVIGHLEGIEVSQLFTLYRCKGGKWVAGPQWETSQTMERDEYLLRIGYVDPEGTSLERLLTADLSAALKESFVQMRNGALPGHAAETAIHRPNSQA